MGRRGTVVMSPSVFHLTVAMGEQRDGTNQGNNTDKYTPVKKRKDLGISKVSKTGTRKHSHERKN